MQQNTTVQKLSGRYVALYFSITTTDLGWVAIFQKGACQKEITLRPILNSLASDFYNLVNHIPIYQSREQLNISTKVVIVIRFIIHQTIKHFVIRSITQIRLHHHTCMGGWAVQYFCYQLQLKLLISNVIKNCSLVKTIENSGVYIQDLAC